MTRVKRWAVEVWVGPTLTRTLYVYRGNGHEALEVARYHGFGAGHERGVRLAVRPVDQRDTARVVADGRAGS